MEIGEKGDFSQNVHKERKNKEMEVGSPLKGFKKVTGNQKMGNQAKQWYETLFENYANQYDKECFTQGTSDECDFIEREASYSKQLGILDLACGTGRHAIELSKRGYKNLVGVDLSESQIKRAKEKAHTEQVEIDFRVEDARNLPFNSEFDLVIMLCEGGFPLMETDEMNFEPEEGGKRRGWKSKICLRWNSGFLWRIWRRELHDKRQNPKGPAFCAFFPKCRNHFRRCLSLEDNFKKRTCR